MATDLLRALGVAMVLGALGLGCAAKPAKTQLIDLHASAHVFHHPQAEVIAAARALLEAKDFAVAPNDGGEMVRTRWRIAVGGDDEFVTAYERYVILVRRLTPEHCRIQALRVTTATGGMETYHPLSPFKGDGSGRTVNTANYGKGLAPLQLGKPSYGRDLALEWELIRKVEPARAELIEGEVKRELGVTAGR